MGSSIFMTDAAASSSATPFAVGLALLRLEQISPEAGGEGVFVTASAATEASPGEAGISSPAGGQERGVGVPWRCKAFLPDWWGDRAAAAAAAVEGGAAAPA
jgi:hypothetical protein